MKRAPYVLALCFSTLIASCASHADVRINEIEFDPAGRDAGREWVELFNASDDPASLKDWRLVNRTGRAIAVLPDVTLPPRAHLVVSFSKGENDLELSNLRLKVHAPAFAVLDNSHDEVALYAGGSGRIVDFIAYALNDAWKPGPSYADAVAAGIWTQGAAFQEAILIHEGESLARDDLGTDTDRPEDWEGGGGLYGLSSTPGLANLHRLAYVFAPFARPMAQPPRYNGGEGNPDNQQEVYPEPIQAFLAALAQIRRDHTGLLDGIAAVLGDGAPVVHGSGDDPTDYEIVVGRIRFKFAKKLRHHGHPAGGLTHPPPLHDGEVCVQISIETVDSKQWLFKDVLIHEIVHAVLMLDAEVGYFDGTRSRPDGLREVLITGHEVLAYLVNLSLLKEIESEFENDARDIRKRRCSKVKQLKKELKKALRDLPQNANTPAGKLRQKIVNNAEEILRHLIWYIKKGRITPKKKKELQLFATRLGVSTQQLKDLIQKN